MVDFLLTLAVIIGAATIVTALIWCVITCVKIARTGWSHFNEDNQDGR